MSTHLDYIHPRNDSAAHVHLRCRSWHRRGTGLAESPPETRVASFPPRATVVGDGDGRNEKVPGNVLFRRREAAQHAWTTGRAEIPNRRATTTCRMVRYRRVCFVMVASCCNDSMHTRRCICRDQRASLQPAASRWFIWPRVSAVHSALPARNFLRLIHECGSSPALEHARESRALHDARARVLLGFTSPCFVLGFGLAHAPSVHR